VRRSFFCGLRRAIRSITFAPACFAVIRFGGSAAIPLATEKKACATGFFSEKIPNLCCVLKRKFVQFLSKDGDNRQNPKSSGA
jgi:hypothetical protein